MRYTSNLKIGVLDDHLKNRVTGSYLAIATKCWITVGARGIMIESLKLFLHSSLFSPIGRPELYSAMTQQDLLLLHTFLLLPNSKNTLLNDDVTSLVRFIIHIDRPLQSLLLLSHSSLKLSVSSALMGN